MILSQELIDKGFFISNVSDSDFCSYLLVKKACYEKYVDEYFGGWVDDVQKEIQIKEFSESNNQSTFKKILLNGEIVGFFAFDELNDKIGGISIQMTEKAQNMGIGSFYLSHVISLSEKDKKPIFLKVFKSNPAQNLYKRFGFEICDETFSHYSMTYNPT
jgi:ribosomal protein S18 acetylase RimI-like enzyme